MSSSSLRGQVRFGGGGSSLHSGIEFGRSRTGRGLQGGGKSDEASKQLHHKVVNVARTK